MSFITERIPHQETAFLLSVLADAEEGEERIRATLQDPTCTAYASWLDTQLAGAAAVRWEEEKPSEIVYVAVAHDLRGRGYGKQIMRFFLEELRKRGGHALLVGRRMLPSTTSRFTRNVASACLKSGAITLPISSRR